MTASVCSMRMLTWLPAWWESQNTRQMFRHGSTASQKCAGWMGIYKGKATGLPPLAQLPSMWHRFFKDNHVPSYPNSPHHLECTAEPRSQGQKSEDEGFYSSSPSISMNNSTPSKPESVFQLSLKHENTAQLHTDCQGVHKLLIPNINPLPIITGSH